MACRLCLHHSRSMVVVHDVTTITLLEPNLEHFLKLQEQQLLFVYGLGNVAPRPLSMIQNRKWLAVK